MKGKTIKVLEENKRLQAKQTFLKQDIIWANSKKILVNFYIEIKNNFSSKGRKASHILAVNAWDNRLLIQDKKWQCVVTERSGSPVENI